MHEDHSQATMDTKPTPADLMSFLSKTGLERFYPNKLTRHLLLEVNRSSISDVPDEETPPWCFLRQLYRVNANCRSCKHAPSSSDDDHFFDMDTALNSAESNAVNPLDLIVALFLCADSFLQQEMALKMSLCQFSVPMLLPHGDNSQCTLMLWALRDIIKEWRPHDLSESRGYVEANIVQANIPFYSFVRLRNCSLSKSQLLNYVMSRGQQTYNVFISSDMEGGAVKREIANGLVEVSWYLPCGAESLDIFPEPVALANLRGDMCESLTQFQFLIEMSTAVFVFMDSVDENEHRFLTSLQDASTKLFVVVNRSGEKAKENMISVKRLVDELNLSNSRVKVKDSRLNVMEFSKKLIEAIKTTLLDVTTTSSIINMHDKAVELGFSVDEWKGNNQKVAAEWIVKELGSQPIPDYKKQHLPLQLGAWRSLSHLEMEECRLKKAGAARQGENMSQVQEKQKIIREEQKKQNVSKAMRTFFEFSKSDKEKRGFFIQWLKFKLNAHSRTKLSELRNKFKEQCQTKDSNLISELDQALLDSSLGIEHYMREMGLIYEFSGDSTSSTAAAIETSQLPGLAAEMLLDGYPLELLDGDASNIPVRWVTDVLMELHKKVGQKSRLLVMTVLGVQSTGKSTLLNTMFGVQFPVSSGRCTRGAFMVFLKVGEDMKSELNCDFIVLIDTEGLKSPDLVQLEDSYEHDNQLATFVIGLSDVTVINIAMENSGEIKDVLQCAILALVRMKKTDKKPVCYFVHQNVAGVSAQTRIVTERKRLLDQLNEMTQIAAEIERKPHIKNITDVLDYDMEKNNWNIPGLWHGTPPMAPVNTGYSEAVAHFKKNLLWTVMGDRRKQASTIPEFVNQMKDLWRTVQCENFTCNLNALVTHAFNNLIKEYGQWEWEFRKEILSWQTKTQSEIFHLYTQSGIQGRKILVESKKSEALEKVDGQERKMKETLNNYYRRRTKHVNLIETFIKDMFLHISNLANEVRHSLNTSVELFFKIQKQAKEIESKLSRETELRVKGLLKDTLSPEEVTESFEEMWTTLTHEQVRDIKRLQKNGELPFELTSDHQLDSDSDNDDLHTVAENIITSCTEFLKNEANTNASYNDDFMGDLLERMDESFEENGKRWQRKFEIDLKLHICGIATQELLKKQQTFLHYQREQLEMLEGKKTLHLSRFLSRYKLLQEATNFVQVSVKPGVKDYICRSLGVDIVDKMLTNYPSAEDRLGTYMQYNIEKELLENDSFKGFINYIGQYEKYVKNWIFQLIVEQMSENKSLSKLQNKNLQVIIQKITEAIDKASKNENGDLLPDNQESVRKLISNMCKLLTKEIPISAEQEKTTSWHFQNTCHPFIHCLKSSINELQDELQEEFSKCDNVTETLHKLPIKPQDELFTRIFGCGKQCPFCSAPCEVRGTDHQVHHAPTHRPQGIGRFRFHMSKKLVITTCTKYVQSEQEFRNTDSNWEWHLYKEFSDYYPDWNIALDYSTEPSDYWKYVLVRYNDKFAEEYDANPADVPHSWMTITKQQALRCLRDACH